MGRVNTGLQAFLRKEWARSQNGVGSMAPKPYTRPLEAVLASCTTGTPFRLPPDQDKMLKALAEKKCFRCHASGITGWKRGGHIATVCKCVQRRIPAVEKALREQEEAIKAGLAEAKADVVTVHQESCDSHNGLDCNCKPTYLEKEKEDAKATDDVQAAVEPKSL